MLGQLPPDAEKTLAMAGRIVHEFFIMVQIQDDD
jgi:hypothetical protein